MKFNEINKLLIQNKIYKILDKINSYENFNTYCKLFINHHHQINQNHIINFIRILLYKNLVYNIKEKSDFTIKVYQILTQNNYTESVIFLNKFIEIYNKLLICKKKFLVLTSAFLKKFKKCNKNFIKLLKKQKINKNEINYIYKIINTDVKQYFLSFFSTRNIQNHFYRLKKQTNKNIQKSNINLILNNIIQLVKIFKLKFLVNFNIKVITADDFIHYSYIEQINYYEDIYNKINNIFMKYNIYYNNLIDLEFKIHDMVNINLFEDCDELFDSTTSEEIEFSEIKPTDNSQFVLNKIISKIKINHNIKNPNKKLNSILNKQIQLKKKLNQELKSNK